MESREQREMEMTVAELDAQLQWYVPVTISGMFDEPPIVIEGSGETLPTARIVEEDDPIIQQQLQQPQQFSHSSSGLSEELLEEGSGHSSTSSTTRRTPIHDVVLDSDDDAARPVMILKPTRPQLCLGNRRNLNEAQIADIREEIREINGMIKYYVKRLMEFCVRHAEYNGLYFKCSSWMDRKQMYYTTYMRLKYCNPVGWPVFL